MAFKEPTPRSSSPPKNPQPPRPVPAASAGRAVPAFNVRMVGLHRRFGADLYHSLRVSSWPRILGVISLIYLACNLLFALLFWVGGDVIANARPGSFADAFYFSVQTMATVGYGGLAPVGPYANLLVVFESLIGLLFSATATGLIFAKFATPQPRVLFSSVAVVGQSDGRRALILRMANERRGHMIVEATVRLTLMYDEPEPHGGTRRRLLDMQLMRDRTPLFQLSFTICHFIDELSPLRGFTPESLLAKNASLVLTFTGIDESLSQTVHARKLYAAREIVFGARFADIILIDEAGTRVIDYRRFHDVVPFELPKEPDDRR